MMHHLLLLLIMSVATATLYEDSRDLCTKKCICTLSNDNTTLYINCDNKDIQHTIANWPDHTSRLMATFRNNTITTLEPLPGSDANDIKLIFSYCNIKYLAAGLLENAMNVKYLDLSRNEIEREQLSGDVFKGPYNNTVYEPIALEQLDLSYNRIHSLQKNVFVHTPHLKYLNLEGNAMRVIDHISCFALKKLTQMQFLNLANNRLTEIPSDAIKHFRNLTEINLAYNELDFVPEALGYAAGSLQYLNISSNPIIEFEHRTFEGLENILKIFANNLNELSEVRARAFSPLRHLKILMLTHCKKLREIDEEAFANLTELDEVYLNDNVLSTISHGLLSWNDLRILDIRNNDFTCNCDLYNISKQLPKFVMTGSNVPYCFDFRNSISMEIDMLTEEICSDAANKVLKGGARIYGNFRVVRITLTTLIIILIISSALAMWLGYNRWKTYKRTLLYAFPCDVVYSPVSTDSSKY